MITTPHPSYESTFPIWQRVRDVMAGEDAIKAAGELYLPRIQSQLDPDYDAYQKRAVFFNATARTAEGYVGLIFRRPPQIKLVAANPGTARPLASFQEDADLQGTSLPAYAKNITAEVVSMGRAGSYIDFEPEPENRAYVTFYRAEQILNWRVERVNGRSIPT